MSPTAIRPKALKPGDTIAFISPSSRLNISHARAIASAVSVLTKRGFKVREVYHPETPGSIQSTITSRLAEFREAFTDPSVAAVICTIGGTTFTELLPSLLEDVELHAAIRSHPKIASGYSDITGVHWFLYTVAGLRTFYGPGMIPELVGTESASGGDSTLDFTVRNLLAAIATIEPIGDVRRSKWYNPRLQPHMLNPTPDASLDADEVAPNPGWTWVRKGRKPVRGRLFGGFLMAMARLAGVRQLAPTWAGRIVFLESAIADHDVTAGVPLERMQAAIADLIAQGVFDAAVGLVVGRPYGYNTPEQREAYMSVIRGLLCEGRLADRNPDFPILFGVDFGHTTPMVTLPYDALAELDGENDRFAVLESGVV
ncbi:peptidase family S66 [Xylariaceae sp. FL1272]|nr:peptidase family S66 [Xylariaceae sp. FL1272]